MSDILHILRSRRKRQNNTDARLQRGSRNTLAGCGLILSTLLTLSVFGLVIAYKNITGDLPPLEHIENLLNPRNGALLQPTRVYDRSGENLIYVFAPEDKTRRYIPIGAENPQHIPESLTQATIALADPDFWGHSGYSLAHLNDPEIHPTLAQKLVAELLLWDEEPSLRRSLRERLLAAQLTDIYGRQKILEWYLNSADYGRYAYGAESAAQLYFGKALTELNLAETATLAATAQSPALNPIDAPIAAYQRRQEVLHILEGVTLINAADAAQARRTDFSLPAFDQTEFPAPAFLPLMLTQLNAEYPRERITRGGLTIISTLDLELQQNAQCILQTQIIRLSRVEQSLCDAASLLPPLPASETILKTSGSAVVLDPVNGQILALVGETKFTGETSLFAAHKSGSSLSPFVYLTAFTRGLSPASLLWDIPNELGTQNFDGEFRGPLSLRSALANDYQVPLENILAQMGAENVSRIAKSFGLTFDAFQAPDAEFTPLTLAQAYGIFAAEGVMYGQDFDGKLASTTLLTVQDADGKLWLDWREAKSQPVVTPELAFLMTDILSDGAARWESLGTRNALEVGLPAAAKIGQRADFSAEWTLGYSPLRVAVVWLGADEALPPQSSAGIWHALIKSASAALPPTSWDTPAEITVMDVCEPSGLLPTIDCPNIVEEVFLNGSEPSQYDNLHRSFEVNRETGFLATVFTPPELVEKHQYLLPPAEAQSWAEAVGLPAPPASYDAIVAPPRVEDAYIAAPDFFDDVRGVVDIRGTAAGEGFVHYRVQVGQGLNPQRWTVVGEDIDGTIHNNTLAVWDASELSGLYAIQLLVVYEDQRVEISTIQVSVDNEAPTVKIIFPQNDEKLEYAKNRQIEFQIDAEDNLGIEKVEIYLNLRQITILTEAPYLWTWASSKGEHTLRLRVYDRAGNITEETIHFVVE